MKKLILSLFLILFISSTAFGAIAVDGTSSNHGSTVGSLTISHTVTSNSNGILFVGISIQDGSANVSISGVTYNGVAMTQIPQWAYNGGFSNYLNAGYYLLLPNTGTHNIVVTLGGTYDHIVSGGISFTGVDQSTSFGTVVNATDFTSTPTIDVSSATNELVVDNVLAYNGGAITVGGGQTQRYNDNDATIYGGGGTEPGAATVTMSWTVTSSTRWLTGGVPIKPSSGGAVAPNFIIFGVDEVEGW